MTTPAVRTWRVRRFMHTPDRLAWVVTSEREALGLSIGDLAAAAGITPGQVQSIESGRPAAGVPEVQAVLDVLGVKPLALPGELARVPA